MLLRLSRFKLFSAVLFCASAAAQQTIDINVPNGNLSPYLVIQRGLTWGIGGFGGVNNNFIFRTFTSDEAVCVYITNNNTTNAHPVTITVAQTGDPANATFINNGGNWQTISSSFTQPQSIPAATTKAFYYRATGSANVMVGLSGSTTLGGSPETANLFVVQTTQGCGNNGNGVTAQGPFQVGTNVPANQQFPILIGGMQSPGSTSAIEPFAVGTQGSGFIPDGAGAGASVLGNGYQAASNFAHPNAVIIGGIQEEQLVSVCPVSTFGNLTTARILCGYAKNSILEMATDLASITAGNMTAWTLETSVTNPAAGSFVLGDTLNTSSTVNVAYKTLVVSCSAACEVQLKTISSNGTTCGTPTPTNLNAYGGPKAAFNANHTALSAGCAANPTAVGTLFDFFIPANDTRIIDLTGFINARQVTQTAGVGLFNVGALTGTMTATETLVEQ